LELQVKRRAVLVLPALMVMRTAAGAEPVTVFAAASLSEVLPTIVAASAGLPQVR
jgi:ABC-type molybdate transport system substrate-binding protein